jgi:hypothetical protein
MKIFPRRHMREAEAMTDQEDAPLPWLRALILFGSGCGGGVVVGLWLHWWLR